MQIIKCAIVELEEATLARVVRGRASRRERRDSALIVEVATNRVPKGYSALIISEAMYSQSRDLFKHTPLVICECSDYRLSENDVVLIDPAEKKIIVLFESRTEQNGLFVTDRCNSRCVMCPQSPKSDSADYLLRNRKLIGMIKTDPEYLTITGGEPMLLGEDLVGLIRLCREKLPSTKLMVLTNARRLMDEKMVASLAKVSQGAVAFAIPVYADTESEHDFIVGATGALSQTMRGCQNLALYKLPVEIRVVITNLNYKRLPQIADFIYRNLTFAFHIALMGMEVQDLAKDNLDQVWVDPYEYRNQLLEAVRYLYRRGLRVSIYNHQLCTLPRILWPLCVKSISRWKNIYMPQCEMCSVQKSCGGFFASSSVRCSKHIAPIHQN